LSELRRTESERQNARRGLWRSLGHPTRPTKQAPLRSNRRRSRHRGSGAARTGSGATKSPQCAPAPPTGSVAAPASGAGWRSTLIRCSALGHLITRAGVSPPWLCVDTGMGGATQTRQSGNNLAVDRHGSEPGPSLLHKSLTYECGDMGMVAGAERQKRPRRGRPQQTRPCLHE